MGISRVSIVRSVVVCGAVAFAGLLAPAAGAATIIDEWPSVKVPKAPELKPVTADPKTTALLMLDFMHQNCNKERRPRCVDSLPAMKKLLEEARAHNVFVVYSIINNTTTKDIWAEVAPKGNEPWVQAAADKFIKTDLEKILNDKGIKTVITVGTAAQGAVLYTASGAAFRGLNVIVPVDGSTAEDAYYEQYVVYQLSHGPGVSNKVTLTKSDMIKF
jgi:nicotinamidase-related amidase